MGSGLASYKLHSLGESFNTWVSSHWYSLLRLLEGLVVLHRGFNDGEGEGEVWQAEPDGCCQREKARQVTEARPNHSLVNDKFTDCQWTRKVQSAPWT